VLELPYDQVVEIGREIAIKPLRNVNIGVVEEDGSSGPFYTIAGSCTRHRWWALGGDVETGIG
jgi:hypothetical protein